MKSYRPTCGKISDVEQNEGETQGKIMFSKENNEKLPRKLVNNLMSRFIAVLIMAGKRELSSHYIVYSCLLISQKKAPHCIMFKFFNKSKTEERILGFERDFCRRVSRP